MYLFMYRELIRHMTFFKMTHQNYKKTLAKARLLKKSKINFQKYEFYRSSYNFYFSKIYNILGDGDRDAISYYNLTNDGILKKHSLLLEKNQEKRQFLNQFKNKRGWSSHFNISDGRAKIPDLNTINNNRVEITIPEYADISLAIDLYKDNENFLNHLKIVQFHVERDFHLIFNERIDLDVYFHGTTTKSDLKYSTKSFEYSQNKKFRKW